MSSMFRRPGESSSSSEDSDDRNEDANASQDDLDLLSRISTINSNSASAQTGSGRQTPLSTRPGMSRNNSRIRDLVLHALLEEKAKRDAAEHLGKDVSDPEVQKRGLEAYKALSRQLSGSNNVDERFASDEMRPHRATAQEGIEAATRSYLLTGLSATAATGDSLALVPQNVSMPPLGLVSGISSPLRVLFQNYSGLHTDRYVREFIELNVVGKGGYGKVYKVQHKLDNSVYAVKRIVVSRVRLQRMHENGPQEMEQLLEEVRAMSRFDHPNIVRYHNAWLEVATGPADVAISMPPPSTFHGGRFIQDASSSSASFSNINDLNADFNGMSFGDQFGAHDQEYGDVVFENSETCASTDESHDEAKNELLHVPDRTPKRSKRRSSQTSHLTIATVSSSYSRMSAVESEHSEDDEDVEVIPRKYDPHSQEPTSDLSDSIMSNSDVPTHFISSRMPGPVLTLNVQMSLYETSLAAFINPEQPSFENSPSLHHCFHPCITLEILKHVVSGVEYLHAEGVVHRDLKPANIFLSLSTSRIRPKGSVDLCTCHDCYSNPPLSTQTSNNALIRTVQHMTPRIGDFGLVAALGNPTTATEAAYKPVGTEFYRPTTSGSVSEKLDVFALGIVAFEMLAKFDTKSERAHALMSVRRGKFPDGFAEGLGECGERVRDLLAGMINGDEHERMGCEDVRREIQELIRKTRK